MYFRIRTFECFHRGFIEVFDTQILDEARSEVGS